jgi:ABC-type proline/glycine betaine transport system permease subunit
MNKKHTLTLLTALLLASFAALYLGRTLPRVPRFGKIIAGSFQALETFGAMASKDWN